MGTLGLGHSTRNDPSDAAAEAAERACAALGGAAPAAAVVVSTGAYGGEAAQQRLAARACAALGTAEIAGAALDGLMVGGAEWTGEPAVAVLAWAEPAGRPEARSAVPEVALFDAVGGHEDDLGTWLASAFGSPLGPGDLVVCFAEPHAIDGARLARSLGALAAGTVVGIAAGETTGESQPVWAGDEIVRGGLAALRLPSPSGTPPRVALTQAGRPIGEPMRITRARGHWIASLEDRPAIEVYRDAAPAPLRDDLARAARSVLVALEGVDAQGAPRRRIRNVIGFDEARGAFSVAEAPAPGERLALVALDARSARDELGRLGAHFDVSVPAAGALYLNCRARAQALFEHEGYELGRVESLVGGLPVLGLMGSHLYAPAEARAPVELHTYAALAALIDA